MVCWATYLTLKYTQQHSISGGTTLGNSDVLLISAFDSRFREVTVHLANNIMASAKFYQGPCSEIGPFPQLRNSTTELAVTERSYHGIDEPYVLRGSRVHYTLMVTNATTMELASSLCIANVYVFNGLSKYSKFLESGDVSTIRTSNCLSSSKPLNFTLSTAYIKYYFVGLESHSSATLNITVTGEILEYNITNLSTTECNFSSQAPQCSVQLHHHPSGQEICLLASLQDTDTFVSLSYYSAQPHNHREHQKPLTSFVAVLWIVCVVLALGSIWII